ncbi:MAG: DUF1573 domain-containing protein [bacterium]|nr:DUF1573 domain-containing protein [bacterium]
MSARSSRIHKLGRTFPVAAVLAIALVALPAAAEEPPAPKLELESEMVDMGDLVHGETGTAEFILRNTGSAPLRIEKAQPGCRCTVASFDEEILPGEAGKLRATLDTLELPGGEVSRSITVFSNDPGRPRRNLVVRARVLTSVLLLPERQVRMSNRFAELARPKLLVRKDPTETGTLEITDLNVSVPWLTVTPTRVEEKRPATDGLPTAFPGDWILEMTLGGRPEYGNSLQRVTFKTNLPRQSEIEFQIGLDLRAPLNLRPNRVVIEAGANAPAEPVLVGVRRDLSADDVSWEVHPKAISLELESSGRRFYKAHVRWDGDTAGEGKITFRVGDESIELPVLRR